MARSYVPYGERYIYKASVSFCYWVLVVASTGADAGAANKFTVGNENNAVIWCH